MTKSSTKLINKIQKLLTDFKDAKHYKLNFIYHLLTFDGNYNKSLNKKSISSLINEACDNWDGSNADLRSKFVDLEFTAILSANTSFTLSLKNDFDDINIEEKMDEIAQDLQTDFKQVKKLKMNVIVE